MSTKRVSKTTVRPFRFSIHASNLIGNTLHLTPEAFGCYMRLLLSYWHVGPPKDDNVALASIVGLPPRRWRAVRPAMESFFELLHGEWVHRELDNELHAAYDAIQKNRLRTEKATAARLAKLRDEARNVVPTESVPAPTHVPARPMGQAKGGKVSLLGGFDDDVCVAEISFAAGRHA